MQLARQPAESALDLGVARRSVDAEDLVVVPPRRRHARKVAPTSVVLVERLDKAGELVRGAPDRADRLLVIHSHGAEQAHGAEGSMSDAVRRADEREPLQARMVELHADAHEGPFRAARMIEELDERSPPLQRLEQLLVTAELV